MYVPDYDYEYDVPPMPPIQHEIEYMTVTETLPPHTVTLPPPANTRLAAKPRPDGPGHASHSTTTPSPRTTVVDVLVEDEPTAVPYPASRPPPPGPPPAKWFGGW